MSKDYTIAYKSLSQGEHEFGFRIDESLFAEFPESGISQADIDVRVVLTRCSTEIGVEVELAGSVTTPCDRCLEDCELPVRFRGQFTVGFSDTPLEGDDTQMWINPADEVIDLTQYLYESVLLSLPYQRVHPCDIHGNPLCNPDMLGRFKIVSEQEFDALTEPKGEVLGDNPALAKLRDTSKQE